jgi:hypothetical protein
VPTSSQLDVEMIERSNQKSLATAKKAIAFVGVDGVLMRNSSKTDEEPKGRC